MTKKLSLASPRGRTARALGCTASNRTGAATAAATAAMAPATAAAGCTAAGCTLERMDGQGGGKVPAFLSDSCRTIPSGVVVYFTS